MASTSPPESGTRARTRRAIIDAAVGVFSERPAAALGDVADAAGVARSTLHRYFADRGELIAALVDHAIERGEAALAGASIDDGPPAAALRRLTRSYFEIGPLMVLLSSGKLEGGDDSLWARLESADDPMLGLIRRGLADGTFEPAFDAEWIRATFWAIVYSGWEMVSTGRIPRQSAIGTVVHTLEKALLA
ncbi:TetR/AcrR family transcriptional regulator [Pseudonocardia sp. GCM10023141]|uniref:TetR/AcrR family transcriptional regulator n=1 Tax=Pseudonocardia sp. GCM10023141 TaxID=3252653 RepID=UPI00361A398E